MGVLLAFGMTASMLGACAEEGASVSDATQALTLTRTDDGALRICSTSGHCTTIGKPNRFARTRAEDTAVAGSFAPAPVTDPAPESDPPEEDDAFTEPESQPDPEPETETDTDTDTDTDSGSEPGGDGFVVGISPQAFQSWGSEQRDLLLASGTHSIRVGRHGNLVKEDEAIRFAEANGMGVMLMAGYNRAGGNIVTDASARQAYADMALADVQTFGKVITHVETWNEWNGGMALDCSWGQDNTPCTDPALYTDLLCRVYDAIKPVRPDIVMVGGATAGIDKTFIRGMLEAGADDCMDMISVHAYPFAKTAYKVPYDAPASDGARVVLQGVDDLQTIAMAITGHTIPIAITEAGRTDNNLPEEYRRSADFVTALYTQGRAHPHLAGIWWYALPTVGRNTPLQGYGLLDASLAPKPGYFAFQKIATGFRN